MKTNLFLLILMTAGISNAAQFKIAGSCKSFLTTYSDTGKYISRVEGPSIEELTYDLQAIDFGGASFQARLNPICNSDSCSPDSIENTVSKNGVESGGAVSLGSLAKNGYVDHAVSLQNGTQRFSLVCLIRNQLDVSGSRQ